MTDALEAFPFEMTAEDVCTGVIVEMAEEAFSNDQISEKRKRSHRSAAETSNLY
jgi:hypothetical protein